MLAAVHDIKSRQVEEANKTIDALRKGQDSAQARLDYYSSRPFTNAEEQAHLSLMQSSLPLQVQAGLMESSAGFMHMIPDFEVGIAGFCSSPVSTFRFGGTQIAGAVSAVGGALRTVATYLATQASIAQTMGGYRRRQDDWELQRELAQIDVDQIGLQLDAAQLRLEIAQRELANHELQMQQADEVANFLTSKFTSEDLYGWMVEQLGVLYFRAYELAYDLGKRAERAFQFERGEPGSTFLQPAYFDKLRKGLLAGEQLQLDLRRMEAAYLEQNRRDYEITKHISLAQEYPDALVNLLTVGTCTIDVPESLFDRDYPGHYFRRIKSLSLSLPCVGGAFASVNAKVTLIKSKVRQDPSLNPGADPYTETPKVPDPRFYYGWRVVDSFVVSSGQNDGGLFETNLRDDRYLPCEGAGAIAQIQIELPLTQHDVDPRRVADAILHLRYTARDGGNELKSKASVKLSDGKLYASARRDLPDAWQAFIAPEPGATAQTLAIDLNPDRFPYWATRKPITITKVSVSLLLGSAVAPLTKLTAQLSGFSSTTSPKLTFAVPDKDTVHQVLTAAGSGTGGTGQWSITFESSDLNALSLDDIAVVIDFVT